MQQVPIQTLPHCVPCYDKKDGYVSPLCAAAHAQNICSLLHRSLTAHRRCHQLCSAKKAVAVAAPEDAKEAPDEEIYMTVKLRGQDNSSRIKTMASIKIKAAAPPSDAAPPSRRKSLLVDNAPPPADAAPKRGDSMKVCVSCCL